MNETGRVWLGTVSFFVGMAAAVFVMRSASARSPELRALGDLPRVIETTSDAVSKRAGRGSDGCAHLDRLSAAEVRPPPPVPQAISTLRRRQLLVPIADLPPGSLIRSFTDARSGSRAHEAIDILAPRHTPIRAVDDGCVVKLFQSKAGGLTVYQFDSTLTFAYYYAHLQNYADDLREGEPIARGHVLGSVGTSGNAPPQTPHLHFAIFVLGAEKRWWEGTPIDPYEVWLEDADSR